MTRRVILAVVGTVGAWAVLAPGAPAQVAFLPGVSSFPNGVGLSATPVVSHDRRYVRMTLNPQFTALEGFDTYSVPAAVSGGGLAGGGLRNVGAGGPAVFAGMDGVLPPGSYATPPDPGGTFNPSSDASAFLSGAAGIPVRPRLSAQVAPRPNVRAPSRSRRSVGPPRTRQGKPTARR